MTELHTRTKYTYDGLGRRVQKSNGKLYWYGTGSDPMDETDTAGNLTDEYIFFGGARIARRDSSNHIVYYFADHLGSSRVVTNASGTVLDDADFYPFGGERAYLSSSGNAYKFERKERDTETGNDDFGARFYVSRTGRFLSVDWSAVPAPVPYANLSNPQTLNLYAFVSDNPITYADLDGHSNSQGGEWQDNSRALRGIDNCGVDNTGCEQTEENLYENMVTNTTADQRAEGKNVEEQAREVAQAPAQNQAWSSLSSAQQALVQGGEKAWGGLSAGQQTNFAAITHALEVTTLSNGASALSEIKSVSAINDTNIAVVWNAGAAKALEASGFASRPGWGHPGESGMIGLPTAGGKIKGSFFQAQGIHVLFNDANKGATGHVHIDYRGLFSGHYGSANADVRQNYQTYKQWFGPIPGYNP